MVRRSEQGQVLIELLIISFVFISIFLMLIQVEITGIHQISEHHFNQNKERKIELPKALYKKFYLHEN